jgi:hypothetical protein
MSKYVVTTAFKDKFTEDHYVVGSEYQSEDPERVAFLQEEGFLGKQIQVLAEEQEQPERSEEPEEKPKRGRIRQQSPSEE